MKKTIFISGLSLITNNRGTQALGYGSLSFLKEKHGIGEDVQIITPDVYKNPLKQWKNRIRKETIELNGDVFNILYRKYWLYDIKFTNFIYRYLGIIIGFTPFSKAVKRMLFTAAICGGDGFADIYSDKTMRYHVRWILEAKKYNKNYIFLPQTLGPFNKKYNYEYAAKLLSEAKQVYVRDTAFVEDLNKIGVKYEICDDLSYYMHAMPWDINVEPNAVGINISGLCYYNAFENLAGRFENYKLFLHEIVKYYQSISTPVYLVAHSFNYYSPEVNADDLQASRDFYNELVNKENVILIDKDLKSPEIKYIISKTSFFIGSRMHSCFASIYTKTPVFGLGYSYKYEHNFKRYGLEDSYISVVDLKKEDIPSVIEKIKDIQAKKLVGHIKK
ncbi:hypothetical protein NBRC110019_05890 [Neptunitalea chrysea]|uniref:Polysaccharide pyruvyl transferase domain-containing protein n=1 Tax=Neptunitalea chrysea TaxID=1647581 RepID=A0A9W6B3C5_9FLAO|nr:polysaccharide pyruvyl transferase family protein [Neptunitalea chrysea]GLB51550.1 hypothetical protein NBRC110019_05890 [Neptunitalea chrysea]